MRGQRPPGDFLGNGCSFSPDGIWAEACRWHDWAYSIESAPVTRWRADVDFLFNLMECGCPPRIAVVYFVFVRAFGWSRFRKPGE